MSQLPLNTIGTGPPAAQISQTNKSQVEPSQTSNATTQPRETVTQIAKPVEEVSRSETVELLVGRTEITSQMVESRLTIAAEELSQARAQTARITGEMQAEGLIPYANTRSDVASDGVNKAQAQTDVVSREAVENAYAQTKDIDATKDNATASRIV